MFIRYKDNMRIRLENIRLKAYHGIYPEERSQGNTFTVGVEFDIDARCSASTDNIEDTVNYEDIYAIVRHEMDIPANLLENVVNRIFRSIKNAFPTVDNLKVSVAKHNPFGDGNVEMVVVEMAD